MNENSLIADLFPDNELKVAINLGNAALAVKNRSGVLSGISVDLAFFISNELQLRIKWITYASARQVVESSRYSEWDIAFLAQDPERMTYLEYTVPYLEIEGTYIVRIDSEYQRTEDLDVEGSVISVGRGAAYDLALTRQLKKAQLVRVDTTPGAVEEFVKKKLSAAAGIRGPLENFAKQNSMYRVLPDNFITLSQAVAYSKRLVSISSILNELANRFCDHGRDA